jgi:peptidoglycan/LPS O-acetylase OafA/YrhL
MWISADTRTALAESPVAILLNGQGAVQLFFVLSGFVLAGSLARSGERAPWPRFAVRRVFRIHPPYVAAVFFGIGVAALAPGGGPSPHPAAPALPDAASLARHLAFPGNAGGLLPVGWTLTIELVFSFLMPLLVLAAAFARGLPLLAFCAVLLFGVDHDFARYAIDFALGVVAFQQRDAIAAVVARIGAMGQGALVAASLVLWCAPLLFWSRIVHGYLIAGWFPYEIATMAAGSVGLVVAALEVPWLRRLLSTETGAFLGRISYPSYLLHWGVITLLAPLLVDRTATGNAALIVAVLALTTLASIPFHRFVELPSIALGKRLSSRGRDPS